MLGNLKIGTRLIVAFLIVSAIGACIGWVGYSNSGRLNDLSTTLYERELLGLSNVKEANINLIYAGRARANLLLASSAEERQSHVQNIDKYTAKVVDYMTRARASFETDEGKTKLAQFDRAWQKYLDERGRFIEAANREALREANPELAELSRAVRASSDEVDTLMTDLSSLRERSAASANAETGAIHSSSSKLLMAIICGGVLLGGVLGVVISRSVTGPIRRAVEVANGLSEGDLTMRIEAWSRRSRAAARSDAHHGAEAVAGGGRGQHQCRNAGQRVGRSQCHCAEHFAGCQRASGWRGRNQRLARADDRIDQPEHRKRTHHRRHGHPGREGDH